MVDRERLDLVQRHQHLEQERLVLLLQRQREAVDDAAQDLEQFGDTVVSFGLVYKPGAARRAGMSDAAQA